MQLTNNDQIASEGDGRWQLPGRAFPLGRSVFSNLLLGNEESRRILGTPILANWNVGVVGEINIVLLDDQIGIFSGFTFVLA